MMGFLGMLYMGTQHPPPQTSALPEGRPPTLPRIRRALVTDANGKSSRFLGIPILGYRQWPVR